MRYLGGKIPLFGKLQGTKEIEEDTNKWMHIPCSWIGRINIIKMATQLKEMYRFNANPIKISMAFHRSRMTIPNIYTDPKKTPNSQAILRKTNKIGGSIIPDVKLYCMATVIQTVWFWH